MKELANISNFLEGWMVFTLAILIVVIPMITEILRQVKQHKKDKQFSEFTEKLYNSQLNIYTQINTLVDVMGQSNKEIYNKLNDLIDILYEKFANNITILVAMDLLELVYTRSKLSIIDHLNDIISDCNNYKNGKLRIDRIEVTIKTYISSRYYQDARFLNKLTCKGIALDVHITQKVKPDELSNKIINLLSIHSDGSPDQIYREVKTYLNNYFITITSKAKSELDVLTREK